MNPYMHHKTTKDLHWCRVDVNLQASNSPLAKVGSTLFCRACGREMIKMRNGKEHQVWDPVLVILEGIIPSVKERRSKEVAHCSCP